MKEVRLNAFIPRQSADEVYAAISNFSAYPQYCTSVRKIDVKNLSENVTLTDWEVNFHNGILKWQEHDTFDPSNRQISFRQTAGDIDHFSGSWHVEADGNDATIAFDSCFDLGLPMLADMLDPVAEQAISENIRAIISGLFPASYIKD
ncbi:MULTISPECIES: type II toxin-antitoxin system RatA family toxin [Pseudomonas]|uniref:SRPBCC family protein n=1 Tax=Pseudomonas donghuensis TaxID=1163398 RepID=A0AAP0SC97_9PSED|nr:MULTISPECIES: SRPBCC family protein [Pseudomonas]KDN97933.1 SRPBCC family protein [Pseudomonas donghuensis]MCP6693003.1 SRPBCC family protein [Pseudomonas donghuensis]MDF9894815.1 ribosome-associated toxin RatA of RatAB toxin-antitoxin module [Pseudomonas vranovensis]QHF29813.1 polyketide cyclase [Pseudomonas sp. R32]